MRRLERVKRKWYESLLPKKYMFKHAKKAKKKNPKT